MNTDTELFHRIINNKYLRFKIFNFSKIPIEQHNIHLHQQRIQDITNVSLLIRYEQWNLIKHKINRDDHLTLVRNDCLTLCKAGVDVRPRTQRPKYFVGYQDRALEIIELLYQNRDKYLSALYFDELVSLKSAIRCGNEKIVTFLLENTRVSKDIDFQQLIDLLQSSYDNAPVFMAIYNWYLAFFGNTFGEQDNNDNENNENNQNNNNNMNNNNNKNNRKSIIGNIFSFLKNNNNNNNNEKQDTSKSITKILKFKQRLQPSLVKYLVQHNFNDIYTLYENQLEILLACEWSTIKQIQNQGKSNSILSNSLFLKDFVMVLTSANRCQEIESYGVCLNYCNIFIEMVQNIYRGKEVPTLQKFKDSLIDISSTISKSKAFPIIYFIMEILYPSSSSTEINLSSIHTKLSKLLLPKKTIYPFQTIEYAIQNTDIEMIKYLLEKGYSVNQNYILDQHLPDYINGIIISYYNNNQNNSNNQQQHIKILEIIKLLNINQQLLVTTIIRNINSYHFSKEAKQQLESLLLNHHQHILDEIILFESNDQNTIFQDIFNSKLPNLVEYLFIKHSDQEIIKSRKYSPDEPTKISTDIVLAPINKRFELQSCLGVGKVPLTKYFIETLNMQIPFHDIETFCQSGFINGKLENLKYFYSKLNPQKDYGIEFWQLLGQSGSLVFLDYVLSTLKKKPTDIDIKDLLKFGIKNNKVKFVHNVYEKYKDRISPEQLYGMIQFSMDIGSFEYLINHRVVRPIVEVFLSGRDIHPKYNSYVKFSLQLETIMEMSVKVENITFLSYIINKYQGFIKSNKDLKYAYMIFKTNDLMLVTNNDWLSDLIKKIEINGVNNH